MAVVAGFKDSQAGLDVHLEPFEGLLLQRRPGGRPRRATPAGREREGSDPQLDSAPVTGGELAGQVLLVGSQGHADDSLSLSDGGEDPAAGLRGSLLEGALDLLVPAADQRASAACSPRRADRDAGAWGAARRRAGRRRR